MSQQMWDVVYFTSKQLSHLGKTDFDNLPKEGIKTSFETDREFKTNTDTESTVYCT